MSTDAPRHLPHVTVATIVSHQGRLLFVEEESTRGLVLNQPAGHLEAGETLLQAALRETREESAWTVRLTHLVGIYQWRAPDGQDFVRFGFAADPVEHHVGQPLDTGIHRALWLTPAQMRGQSARLRSPLVAALVEDWLGGARHPLALARSIGA